MDTNSGLDSLFAELHLFTMPAIILIVGLGFGIISSWGSKTKQTLSIYLEDTATVETTDVSKLSPASTIDESIDVTDQETEIILKTASALNLSSTVAPSNNNKKEDIPAALECSMMWLDNQGPVPRVGGCALFDSGLGLFTVAGGMANDKLFDDVHVYAADENEWTDYSRIVSDPVSELKGGFVYGSMGKLSDQIILFGGINKIRHVSDIVFLYDFERRQWGKASLITTTQPRGRFNATIVSWDNTENLILFGGQDGTCCLNDVWKLSLINNKVLWTELFPNHDSSSITADDESEDGCMISGSEHFPLSREAHSTVILHDKMIVFGGNSINGDYIDIREGLLEVFDLNRAVWELHAITGEGPSRLAGCGSAHSIQSSNTIIVISRDQNYSFFNDIYVINVSPLFNTNYKSGSINSLAGDTMHWNRITLNWIGDPTMPPSSRIYFSAALDECEGQLYIFGGQNLTSEYPILSEASDVIVLEPGTIIIDMSSFLDSLDDNNVTTEKSEVPDVDLNKCSIPIPLEERDVAYNVTKDERHVPLEVNEYLSKIFGDIEDMRRSNPFFSNVENETLEDFLKIRDQIDLKFAEKYLPESDILAIKSKLSDVNDDDKTNSRGYNGSGVSNIRSTCPLPQSMRSNNR